MCPPSDSPNKPAFHLTLPSGELAVHTFGTGPKALIALHGFDYDGQTFASWATTFGQQYTIYAPDLPFHGASRWAENHITPAAVQQIINSILVHTTSRSFSLLGHSFGARLLLCTAPDWPLQPEQIILLAPAGIGSYDRVLPRRLQHLVEYSLRRPSWLRFLVQLGAKLGLVSRFHQRYAEVQLYPPAQRFRLFRTFNSLPFFRTGTARISQYWHSSSTPCLVVVASDDRFVPTPKIITFFRDMPTVQTLTVQGTHQLVNERVAKVVFGKLSTRT